jgi:arabinooligosaccharide transport system permease protein
MSTRLVKRATPYLFISPFFIGFAVFGAFPLGWALFLSLFHQTGLLQAPTWVGLGNYQQLLSDTRFWHSLWNTTLYAIGSIFIILPFALLLALIIDSPLLRFKQFFRLGLFLPSLTSSVVIGIMFGFIFEPSSGLLNALLRDVHLPAVGWLVDSAWVIPSIILVGLWNYAGINTLYFSAGLQNIPRELLDAALIDGASRRQALFYVTLPLLRPTLLLTVILAIIGSYNLFGLPYILLAGGTGPSDAGLFMTVYLYQTSFQNFEFGYAAAIGFAMAIIIMVLSLVQLRLFGAFEEA